MDKQTNPKSVHGAIIPLVTPINGDGRLDEAALRRLVDHVAGGGVQGIFVLGTTGEGPSVPRAFRQRVVQVAVEQAQGRAAVYAGTADTVFTEIIAAASDYLRIGARAVVVQLPAYFHLSAGEQFSYFSSLVKSIAGPILLYDIPAAVHMTIDVSVIEHLRAFSHVVGIKDSSGDQERLDVLLDAYADDPGFSVLVGSVPLAAYGFRNGADGFVPSTGNLEPVLCARMYAAAQTGDWALMDTLQREIDLLTGRYMSDRMIGQGIARLKYMLSERGLCGPKVLLPLKEDDGRA